MPEGAPRAGERFPWMQLLFTEGGQVEDFYSKLDDSRFNLVVVGQAADRELARTLGPLVKVHDIHAEANEAELKRAQLPATCFYLVRPDGHIGLAGARLDRSAILRYLEDLGLRSLTNAHESLSDREVITATPSR